LVVSIVDDGRGFDVATVDEQRPAGHWGLQGMQERARKIRARFEISSRPGVGTAVELKVPASIAFRRKTNSWFGWPKFWRNR
jgi:signal transduction histidine kinase